MENETPLERYTRQLSLDQDTHSKLEGLLGSEGEIPKEIIYSIVRYPKVKEVFENLMKEQIEAKISPAIHDDRGMIRGTFLSILQGPDAKDLCLNMSDSKLRTLMQVYDGVVFHTPLSLAESKEPEVVIPSYDEDITGQTVIINPVDMKQNTISPNLIDITILTSSGEELQMCMDQKDLARGIVETKGEVIQDNGIEIVVKLKDQEVKTLKNFCVIPVETKEETSEESQEDPKENQSNIILG